MSALDDLRSHCIIRLDDVAQQGPSLLLKLLVVQLARSRQIFHDTADVSLGLIPSFLGHGHVLALAIRLYYGSGPRPCLLFPKSPLSRSILDSQIVNHAGCLSGCRITLLRRVPRDSDIVDIDEKVLLSSSPKNSVKSTPLRVVVLSAAHLACCRGL